MPRLFVAIDPSAPSAEQLAEAQQELAHRLEDSVRIRWVPRQNLHLTLKFIGETAAERVDAIRQALGAATRRLGGFELQARSLGCFPRPDRPRVLWAGLSPDSLAEVSDLQRAVESGLVRAGFAPAERNFVPHITLGRVKSAPPPNLVEMCKQAAGQPFGTTWIDEIVLYESHLDSNGARHRVVDRFAMAR